MQSVGFLLRELVLGLIMLKNFKIYFIVKNVCVFAGKNCKFAKLTAEKSFFLTFEKYL